MLDNSLENVVQVIFSECDISKTNNVRVEEVINFITPFLQPNVSELVELEEALKENSDSGIISKSLFMETMTIWTAKYKDCTGQLEDSFEGMLPGRKSDINDKSFVHSTPRSSLGILNHDLPLLQELLLNPLNISSASCPDVRLNKTILEDRIRDLEHTNWRLAESIRTQKEQEQIHEDVIDSLRRDLDLTKNKYTLAQKLLDSFSNIDANKSRSSVDEISNENNNVDLATKYQNLQIEFDIRKAEFAREYAKLEYEKFQFEQRNLDLERRVFGLRTTVQTMQAVINDKNLEIEKQRKENEAVLATNNDLSLNVTELTSIIETFKSQQKKMEKNLRKSLCYNDKLQTSFNALQAVKAIGEYSKSKRGENKPKAVNVETESKQEVRSSTGVPFCPPFNNSKFNFYDINSPKIRKSPTKDKNNMSMMDTPKDSEQEDDKNSDNDNLLSISSPPVMYVVYKTPPTQNTIINNSFDYSEISCDEEAKFSHLEPKSPHMSLRTEMQEALSCCCEDIKQVRDSQISALKENIQILTADKETLRKEIVECSKHINLLENDKLRNATSMRNLELEIQSFKCKEYQTIRKDFANVNQARQKDTFDKLKMKLEKYENLLEAKQEDLNHIKMACEVYKARLAENDTLISAIYANNKSLTKLLRTVNEDLQSQVDNFMEICHDELSNSPRVMELLQCVIGVSRDDLDDLSTGVLDFSRRISYVTEVIRILADSKLELNATITALQSNRPAAVDINSPRFKCDSPDSPSTNTLHFFNKTENLLDCTVLGEVDGNITCEENKNLSTKNAGISRHSVEASTQTTAQTKLRTNGVTLPSVGLLLAIIYLLYETRNVHYRNDRTM